MKNITIKETITMSPQEYAVLRMQTGSNVNLVTFACKSDSESESAEMSYSLHSIDCDLLNVKESNRKAFIREVACAYYLHMSKQAQNKQNDIRLDDKGNEKTLSWFKKEQLSVWEEIEETYDNILEEFTAEEKAYCVTVPMVQLIAGSVSGDFSALSRVGIMDVRTSLKDYYSDKPEHEEKHYRNTVSTFTRNITGQEDDLLTGYTLNCNARLWKEVSAVFYKGRSYSKKTGLVSQKYDVDLNKVIKEIALAIIGDLQRKKLEKKVLLEEIKPEPAEVPKTKKPAGNKNKPEPAEIPSPANDAK